MTEIPPSRLPHHDRPSAQEGEALPKLRRERIGPLESGVRVAIATGFPLELNAEGRPTRVAGVVDAIHGLLRDNEDALSAQPPTYDRRIRVVDPEGNLLMEDIEDGTGPTQGTGDATREIRDA